MKMRLIDADALKKELHTWDMQDLYLPVHFEDMIDDAPTVDAVQVVRCKDCEHWKREENQVGEIGDDYFCAFGQNKSYREDFFCADGERKNATQSNESNALNGLQVGCKLVASERRSE